MKKMIVVLFISTLMISGCDRAQKQIPATSENIQSPPPKNRSLEYIEENGLTTSPVQTIGTMTYQIERLDSSGIRVHVDKELTAQGIIDCSSNSLVVSICDGLNPIPGVTGIFVRRYGLQMEKAPLFEWDKILKSALPVIERYKLDKTREAPQKSFGKKTTR